MAHALSIFFLFHLTKDVAVTLQHTTPPSLQHLSSHPLFISLFIYYSHYIKFLSTYISIYVMHICIYIYFIIGVKDNRAVFYMISLFFHGILFGANGIYIVKECNKIIYFPISKVIFILNRVRWITTKVSQFQSCPGQEIYR